MAIPFRPVEAPRTRPPLSARLLALWLGLGGFAVVLIAVSSPLFDLDRFTVPKELALHLTGLGALLLLASRASPRAALVATEIPLLAFAGWSAVSALFASNHWLSTRALALTVTGLVLFRAAGGLAVMLWAVLLTRSRAAWLGVGISGIVVGSAWLLAGARRRAILPPERLRLVGKMLAAGVAAALLLPNSLSWRSGSPYRDTFRDLTNYQEGSGRGRLIQYRNSLRLVAMDPVFGTGPGNWPVKYPMVTTRGDPSFDGRDPMPINPWPSSDWVAFLAERGPVGSILLLLAFGVMGLTAVRRVRSDDPARGRRALALLGVLTATLVTGAFDAVLLLPPPTLFFWAAAGLLLPVTGTVGIFPWPVRGRLLPLLVLGVGVAAARSAGQLEAIITAGPGWPVERLGRAVRFDPGSYRLHLMIAQRTPCWMARTHAVAAARLFPYLPAPRHRLAACSAQ